jgi:hypothetical protein
MNNDRQLRGATKEQLIEVKPWVNARIDIPKSVRKGKTYEQILEIKKEIWLKQREEL